MAETAVREPETPTDLDELGALGAALGQAVGKAKEQDRIKDEILKKIATLDEDAAKALFKNEKVRDLYERISYERAQASDDPPGTIRSGWIGNAEVQGFVKKGWTESDLRRDRERNPDGAGKLVTFTPTETMLVIWNGLKRQLIAEEDITVEKCFYDTYQEHRRAAKVATEHAGYLFNKRNTLSDFGVITAETARVRGMSEPALTHYVPGGGSIITAEPATTPSEEAPGEGAGEE